jgi:hypothetical protein
MRIATGVIAASGTITQLIPPALVLVVLADQLGRSVGDMYKGAIGPSIVQTLIFMAFIGWSPFFAAMGAAAAQGGAHAQGLGPGEPGPVGDGPFDRAHLPRAGDDLHGHRHADRGRGARRRRSDRAGRPAQALDVDIGPSSHGYDHAHHRDGDVHPDRLDGVQSRLSGGGRWALDRDHLAKLPGGEVGFLIFVNLFVFFLAFFLDFFEIAFIVVPLLAPVAHKMGIDLIWFGVLLCVTLQTSFMHPPFGFACSTCAASHRRKCGAPTSTGGRFPGWACSS